MTPVVFHFLTPDGVPLAATEVLIQLSKSSFDADYSGVLMPREIKVVTDVDGKVTVNLWPSNDLYYVSVLDTVSEAELFYKFYVPELEAPNTFLRLQDIIVEGTLSTTPWDNSAIQQILAAKANTLVAAASAQASALSAQQSATVLANAGSSASLVLTQINQAKDTVTTLASQVNTDATTSTAAATTATTKASQASTSAGAANSSQIAASESATAAATSASSALASKNAAKTSEDNAKSSETSAATSASTASTNATTAVGAATNAVTSKGQAEASATAANTSAVNAATSATTATNRAGEATTAASLAQAWASQTTVVANGFSSAKTYAEYASNSATTATTKAGLAATSETNAASSATAAGTSASNASASATTATTKASEALASANTAKDWATKLTEVETGKKSALVYAQEAAASAATAASSANAAVQGQMNSDWNESNPANKSFIINKPIIPTTVGPVFTDSATVVGPVNARGGNTDTLLRTQNSTAANAEQFFVRHNNTTVEVGNSRGSTSFLGNATSATLASTVYVGPASNVNSNLMLPMTSGPGNSSLITDGDMTYNPSTNTLTVGTVAGALSGNATSATTAVTATNVTNLSANQVQTALAGTLYLAKTSFPQLNLHDNDSAVDAGRWGMWVSPGGASLALGPQTDAGAGTQTMAMNRDGFTQIFGRELVINNNSVATDAALTIDAKAGQARATVYRTAGVNRWVMGAGTGAEAGSNAGSDFFLHRYSDAGAWLGTTLTINRATGTFTFANPIIANSTITSGSDIKGPILSLTGDRLENYSQDIDTAAVGINYTGYAGGTTRFRDLIVFNGKMQGVMKTTGSNKNVTFYGGISVLAGATITGGDVRLKGTQDATGYGVFLRNDGVNFYLLNTANNDSNGVWNALRPFSYNLATGDVSMNHKVYAGVLTTAQATVSSGFPSIILNETDQAGTAGKWRIAGDGGNLYIDNNTAAANDHSTITRLLTITPTELQTGLINMQDNSLSRAKMIDCGHAFLDKGNSGTAAQTLDYTAGGHQRLAVTGAFTLSTSNWPPTGVTGFLMLELVNGAAFAVTWPTINWVKSDGSTTTAFGSNGVTLRSSGVDFILLWTRNGGTTIYGKVMR